MSKFFNVLLSTGSRTLLNLNNVSRIELNNKNPKVITFIMAREKDAISGNFLWFSGGDNCKYSLTFEKEEDALEEYEKIRELINL